MRKRRRICYSACNVWGPDDVTIVMVCAGVIAKTMECWEDSMDAIVRVSFSGFGLMRVWKQKMHLRFEE
ncbi:hypothetical protein Scep_027795 [Stephania cephalantha]|uniref:Uncharacterized protein n=1 Tax=Stephania cephalantha TaxID=152367 RepID=A0AAP0EBV4_9MAGN